MEYNNRSVYEIAVGMHRLILYFMLISPTLFFSQILINETLTTQQLIEGELFNNNACFTLSNFVSSTGTNYGEVNGIAAFDKNGTSFPYASGVILSSGNVQSAPGPNLQGFGEGTFLWLGDADLEFHLGTTNTFNASYIQFDLLPFLNQISFNFILASSEFNQNYECLLSDGLAFILTDQVTSLVQNLALVPGTATPINTTTIHPEVFPTALNFNTACPAINEIYFDRYNFLPYNDPNTSLLNYNGQTTSMSIVGDVVPGNNYTIKIVIADQSDGINDIAIFLESGSFSPKLNLGTDLIPANGNEPCEGDTVVVGIVNEPSVTYQWSKYNTATLVFDDLLGETNSTLPVTQSGIYQLLSTLVAGCSASDDVVVQFAPAPKAGVDGNLIICLGDTVTAPQLFAQLGGTPDATGAWTPALAGAGVYTYTVTATAPCLVNDTSTVTVTNQNPPDITENLTGSTITLGFDATITVTGADVGVTYEVILSGAPLVPPVTAVGAGVDLVLTIPAAQLTLGNTIYGIRATFTGCTNTLTDTANIFVNTPPYMRHGKVFKDQIEQNMKF